jgi:tripartite-type tricarboxylate transporter receptor subunit TctC
LNLPLLRLLAFALTLLYAPAAALAQAWPSGTVKIIVPYAPGGPLDFTARLLIDRLAAQTKGTFILDHRPGAGTTIGAQAVAQSPADGSTFLYTTASLAVAPAIYPKLPFDPLTFTPISLITEAPITVVVRADHPLRDIADLIAKAKAAPGKYTFGSGGVGSGNHLAGEMLKQMAGIDLLHVPYRGSAPSMAALYAGDIDMVVASTVETLAHVRDGRVRMLGIGAPQRIAELPDVPAIAEVVPGYAMSNWHALFGPAGLPAGIVARIQAELPKMRNDPSLVKISKAAGVDMMFTSADVLRARMEAEVPRWKKLVPTIGLQQQ